MRIVFDFMDFLDFLDFLDLLPPDKTFVDIFPITSIVFSGLLVFSLNIRFKNFNKLSVLEPITCGVIFAFPIFFN